MHRNSQGAAILVGQGKMPIQLVKVKAIYIFTIN